MDEYTHHLFLRAGYRRLAAMKWLVQQQSFRLKPPTYFGYEKPYLQIPHNSFVSVYTVHATSLFVGHDPS